jgi:hypothetical protein
MSEPATASDACVKSIRVAVLISVRDLCPGQVLYPELQRRQMMRARKRRLHTNILKGLASSAMPFGSLLHENGAVNDEVH